MSALFQTFTWDFGLHTHILVHLHVNKTNFYMKGFALGLALKQRRKATRKSPISVIVWPMLPWPSSAVLP